MLKKIFNGLFVQERNVIQNLYGIKKDIANFLIIGGIIKRNPKELLKNPKLKLQRLPKFLSKFKNNKFVYFNGSIFLDCFAPPWPSVAFNRIVDGLVRRFTSVDFNWMDFTIALIISITKKCVYRCEHCYAIQTLGNEDILSVQQLLTIAKGFQKLGIGVIAWEGGEPLLRFDELLTLIKSTTPYSDAWIATTAYGLTHEKARKLREAGVSAAIISLDHYDRKKHNEFRRNKSAFDMAINGVRIFRENGILPNICVCATRNLMEEDGLWKYLELAKKLGVGFIQILDATPSGNYIDKDVLLTNKQVDVIKKFHIEVNTDPRYRDYPSISARALLESDNFYGCTAGNSLVYVDSSGNLQACDLLQISFGNVLKESVNTVYKRMKNYIPHYIHGRCPAQTLHKYISEVYKNQKSLPISFKDCEHILEKLRRRGLPTGMKF
jgi:MoaA/NifB/PqqE/SkfB family radical SAM enzyme